VTEHRDLLIKSLEALLTKQAVDRDRLSEGLPDWRLLEKAEQDAFWALIHWADDADIRARDSSYEAMRIQEAGRYLSRLRA
jgi:hypothetical protein